MVNIQKSGDSAIKFTFTDNDRYLYDGEITVPLNSLILVLDESDMVVIKKVDGDVFLTFLIGNSNFSSKSDLESWFKTNACSTGGGGGGGVTSGEVETMIDNALVPYAESSAVTEEISEAVSGKADTSDVQNIASNVATVSGDVNTLSGSVNTLTGDVNTLSGDVSTLSGQVQTNEATLTAHTANTNIHVTAQEKTTWNNKSDFSGSYNDLTDKPTIPVVPTNVSDFNNDAGYVTQTDIDESISGKADASDVYTKTEVDSALSGKQDTLSAGTGISIVDNVISAEGGGGGKAIVAGTNISVTTGETADTVNCTLPFIIKNNGIAYNNTWGNITIGNGNFSGVNSIFTRTSNSGSSINADIIAAGGSNKFTGAAQQMLIAGNANEIKNTSEGYSSAGGNGIIVGQGNKINYSRHNYVLGDYNTGGTSGTTQQEINNYLLIFGERNKTNNTCESTFGRFNNSVSGSSTFGDSGNTLFSVGNGTADNARHNAFEIRQNGDIYITKDGSDVKLQDELGGGGVDSGTVQSMIDDSLVNYYDADTIDTQLSAITSAITQTTDRIERVTATALNDLNAKLGGMKLVQLTQAQYDALTVKDNQTLYIITNVVN